MTPDNTLAIVAHDERWRGSVATEPCECGWAREAVFFVRALEAAGVEEFTSVQVQVSPDGLRWVDEGTSVMLPMEADGLECAKVSHFGGWLRLAGELPAEASLTVIVSLHLKG